MRGMISTIYEQMIPRWMFQYKVCNAGTGCAKGICVSVHKCVCACDVMRRISETNDPVLKA